MSGMEHGSGTTDRSGRWYSTGPPWFNENRKRVFAEPRHEPAGRAVPIACALW